MKIVQNERVSQTLVFFSHVRIKWSHVRQWKVLRITLVQWFSHQDPSARWGNKRSSLPSLPRQRQIKPRPKGSGTAKQDGVIQCKTSRFNDGKKWACKGEVVPEDKKRKTYISYEGNTLTKTVVECIHKQAVFNTFALRSFCRRNVCVNCSWLLGHWNSILGWFVWQFLGTLFCSESNELYLSMHCVYQVKFVGKLIQHYALYERDAYTRKGPKNWNYWLERTKVNGLPFCMLTLDAPNNALGSHSAWFTDDGGKHTDAAVLFAVRCRRLCSGVWGFFCDISCPAFSPFAMQYPLRHVNTANKDQTDEMYILFQTN